MTEFLADGNSESSRGLDEVGTAPAENEQLPARRPRNMRSAARLAFSIRRLLLLLLLG